MSFWESVDYKNARKVLVIPNITNSSNIEKDSFIDVIHNHIKALDNCGEYYWNVLVPKGKVTKKLNLPNVKQIEIHIPGDMMNQRSFPSVDLIKMLKDVEYDVIYSHLPDWPQVGRYARWGTKIIGYSHWFEGSKYLPCNGVDRRDGKAKWLWLPVELMGISQMDTCYLNTQDQKNRVLDEARLMFNEDFVSKLDDILTVWNLGVPQDKIVTEVKDSKDNIIVFNHRPAAYKGYPKFIELMEEYRNQRQDFTVWIPQLSGKIPFAWIDNTKVPKHEYYQRLQNCKVGVQMKQTNYGWSVSGTDCMMNGTPMIWHDSDCYHEIDPNGMFFKTKKEFFQHLDNILDDDTFRQERDNMSLQRAKELSLNEDIMIKELHKQLTD
jgi:glycosyltransferase involved in cell wall biosynthesis